MDKNKKLLLLVAALVTISVVLTFLFTTLVTPIHRGNRMYFETFLNIKAFVSTLNILLIMVLLWNYLSIYREMPNRFTLSLTIFSLALLLYALSSNPLVTHLLGFRRGVGLGPFTFLPDIFAAVAVIVLLYQSYE